MNSEERHTHTNTLKRDAMPALHIGQRPNEPSMPHAAQQHKCLHGKKTTLLGSVRQTQQSSEEAAAAADEDEDEDEDGVPGALLLLLLAAAAA